MLYNVVETLNLKNEQIKTLSHKIFVTKIIGLLYFEEKETVKTMSKGGYI